MIENMRVQAHKYLAIARLVNAACYMYAGMCVGMVAAAVAVIGLKQPVALPVAFLLIWFGASLAKEGCREAVNGLRGLKKLRQLKALAATPLPVPVLDTGADLVRLLKP